MLDGHCAGVFLVASCLEWDGLFVGALLAAFLFVLVQDWRRR